MAVRSRGILINKESQWRQELQEHKGVKLRLREETGKKEEEKGEAHPVCSTRPLADSEGGSCTLVGPISTLFHHVTCFLRVGMARERDHVVIERDMTGVPSST